MENKNDKMNKLHHTSENIGKTFEKLYFNLCFDWGHDKRKLAANFSRKITGHSDNNYIKKKYSREHIPQSRKKALSHKIKAASCNNKQSPDNISCSLHFFFF